MIRKAAINELGALRAHEAVSQLVRALSDRDVIVREAAAFALGQIADPRGAQPLVRISKDPVPEVRATAVFSLGMIGDRKSTNTISAALLDESVSVRSSAVTALGMMRDQDAIDELIDMLNDPSFDVRYDAVWALGQLGHPDALPHLRAAMAGLESVLVRELYRELFRQAVQFSIEDIELRVASGWESSGQRRPRRATGIIKPPPTEYKPGENPTVMKPASIKQAVRAVPTERAARAGTRGWVAVRVLVGADGRPVRVYVTRRLGEGLDQRAAQALFQYKFEPAMMGGFPQIYWMNLEIPF